jgi:hypothetical protein
MDGLQFTCDWTSHHFDNWRRWLQPLIGRPAYGCEIGSFEGRSAIFFLTEILNHKYSSLICIDPWDWSEETQMLKNQVGSAIPINYRMDEVKDRFVLNLEAANVKQRAIVYAKSSRRAIPQLGDSSLDFAYIDGSHLACRALEDGVLIWPKLKSGGILIWDDYLWQGNAEPPPGWTVQTMRPKLGVDAWLQVYLGQYDEPEIDESTSQVKLRKR